MYYGEEAQAPSAVTPQGFVLSEPTFEAEEISGVHVRPPMPVATPVPVMAIDPVAEIEAAALEGEIARLKDRVAVLEKQHAGQVRALRALIELLVESGLVSRDEYLTKANRE
jgi:hypothetical protein